MSSVTFQLFDTDKPLITDLAAWCNANNINIPYRDFPNWRLTIPVSATVTGFPHLGACTIEATDGIVAYVRRPRILGHSLLQIHNSNFEGAIEPLNKKPKSTHVSTAYHDPSDTPAKNNPPRVRNKSAKQSRGPVASSTSLAVLTNLLAELDAL
jgi:hypothetical protein